MSGQIRGNRLEILALKPAPLQVAYIGFLGSNGAAFIDYMFTDKTVPPEAHLDAYSEATAFLPHCYLITDDAIVFCSFNPGFKITPDVFDAWCEIIADTKDSALWLLEKNSLAQFNLRKAAQTRGIDGDRLIFANQIPKPGHMARTRLADLALDTGIYTDHVMTCDMLLAGLPVITPLGRHFASRLSASALKAAGLPELMTESWPAFVALGMQLADDRSLFALYRNPLADGRKSAPLFDTARSVRVMEHGFEEIWRRYLDGEAPARIDIPDR